MHLYAYLESRLKDCYKNAYPGLDLKPVKSSWVIFMAFTRQQLSSPCHLEQQMKLRYFTQMCMN